MKRNGAGLASICILLTMVLVMISSTSCLYFGSEDSIQARCPNSVNISTTFYHIDGISDENLEQLREIIRLYSGVDADLTGVRACEISGLITNDGIIIDFENAEFSGISYDRVGYLAVISLSDYNTMMGTDKTLEDDECFLFCNRIDFKTDTFTMEYGKTYKVKEKLREFKVDGDTLAMAVPVVYVVVEDLDEFVSTVKDLKNSVGEPMMVYDWRCGFDIDTPEIEKIMADELDKALKECVAEDENGMYMYFYNAFSRQQRRESFYDMYGSLFFLGIMLSIVFIMAAVLIIYYKQICEGYEDYARFDIMQKIGMTKRDIRRSINSQMLTVFFLPLFFAGIHLAFAFPFISKMLLMFAFNNTFLSIMVNLGCFVIFGIFYTLMYKITSGAYYAIVSGRKEI